MLRQKKMENALNDYPNFIRPDASLQLEIHENIKIRKKVQLTIKNCIDWENIKNKFFLFQNL